MSAELLRGELSVGYALIGLIDCSKIIRRKSWQTGIFLTKVGESLFWASPSIKDPNLPDLTPCSSLGTLDLAGRDWEIL